MNYSLSSSRKIGDYFQKIITTQNNTAQASSPALLNSLKAWHNAFANLDASGREVGAIEYIGFTEAPSAGSSNTGTMADITFTVLSTESSTPKTTTIKVADVTFASLFTVLNTVYNRLVGSFVTVNINYLISAIVNLH